MQKRILLVDDDSIFRSEFKDYFEEYGIAEASNGIEALAIIKRPNEIDLVILDVRMSGMNGIEVLSQIRKLAPHMRIVIITGYGSKDVIVEALRGQADDYIEKTMDLDDMKQVIEKFLDTKRGQPGNEAIDLKEKVKRVKSYLERNALKHVTLKEAAQTVCLSQKYLSRVFKEQLGVGFNDYKLKLKIAEAKNLLAHSGYTVYQIADKLGYVNPESFMKQFRIITKLTPTEFRNKIKSSLKNKRKK